MSKIALSGNASGTGTFTLASPNSNSDRTLSLPDNSGTVLTSASNLVGVTGVGKVLQVVSAGFTTTTSTSSRSYVATTVTASITPTSSTSKVYVSFSGVCCIQAANTSIQATIFRNGASISAGDLSTLYAATHSGFLCAPMSFEYLDSPATTSSTTYTVYIKENGLDGTVNTDSTVKTITLMEIAA